MEKKFFAHVIFRDAISVSLAQVDRGLGKGTTIECAFCEMDVDEIFDSPEAHKEKCNQ